MSGDDPKRRRSRKRREPSDDDPYGAAASPDVPLGASANADDPAAEGGGAFFRAPTRAFQALPTEVLDVGSGSEKARHVPRELSSDEASADDPRARERREQRASEGERRHAVDRSEARKRATRLPPSLFESLGVSPRGAKQAAKAPSGDFSSTPPTEAIDTDEVRRLVQRHQAFPEHETEHLELTNPDPFRVDLDSAERAIFEVAREPTHHDLFLGHEDDPPSETSTDVEVPKPISGVHGLVGRPTPDGFEDNTVALDAIGSPPRAGHPFLDATDEDAALASDPLSLELPPPVPPLMPPEDAQDRYYSELRDVIGAARVFDPKRPAHLVTDPGIREHSDDDWPEITLDPAPPPPARRRGFSLGLLAFLLSVLVVTVGGVGIGFGLSKRGISLDQLVAAWSFMGSVADDRENENAKPPLQDDQPGRGDDETAQTAPAANRAVGIWKERQVHIYFANVDDASRSGARELEATLLKAFTSALASDERARWTVSASRLQARYAFDVSLAVLSVDELGDGGARVRCALNAARRHEPRGRVEASVTAERRAEGSLKSADDEKLAREASRACGFALALDFFPRALAD